MIKLVVYEFGSTSTFEGGIKLAIYNPFEINKADGTKTELIRPVVVSSISECNEWVKIGFSGDEIFLEVDMSEMAYSGSEALLLEIPGQPMVVWRLGE